MSEKYQVHLNISCSERKYIGDLSQIYGKILCFVYLCAYDNSIYIIIC